MNTNMKQITIEKRHFGTLISTEVFIVDGTDMFIRDMLNDYIMLKNKNSKYNDNNCIYNYVITDICVNNRYDFCNIIKDRIKFEENIQEHCKKRLEKLQKHADKYRKL